MAGPRVFAVTPPGRRESQEVALALGAVGRGFGLAGPPEELDAVIVFAPAGELVPAALRAVREGGAVVCAGIHMSDIPSFPYELLWGERACARWRTSPGGRRRVPRARAEMPVRAEVETFPLEEANEALDRLRRGTVRGAAVLLP